MHMPRIHVPGMHSPRSYCQYTDRPVTEVDYLQVDRDGHFAEYIHVVKFDMEADHGSHEEKPGLIIDYKAFQANPKSPDQPNIYLCDHF